MNPLQIDDIDLRIVGDGDDTVVMVHGWPDTWRLWDDVVAALAPTHRCVRFSLPGFEPGSPRRAYTLDEVVQRIGQVVDATAGGRPVTLLLHDWGCVFGYQYAMREPQRVARVIGVDIGDAGSPAHRASLTWRQVAMIAGYQLWLAAAWRIGGRAGDAMTRRMARLLRVPPLAVPPSSAMNYPYYIAWTGLHGSYRRIRPLEPAWPMLYLYGRRKPVTFHSRQWLAALAARPGCRVEAFDTGHWVMRDAPERFSAVVREWLSG